MSPRPPGPPRDGAPRGGRPGGRPAGPRGTRPKGGRPAFGDRPGELASAPRPARRRTSSRPRPGAAAPAPRRAPAPPDPRPVLFVATGNPGKAREIEALLAERVRVIGPEHVVSMSPPAEDGATFEANARKKAVYYAEQAYRAGLIEVDGLVLADDSGLEIDAADGWPGVRSARVGGPAATDADRVRLVLSRLEGVAWERRTARFRCVIAVANRREGILAMFEGVAEGRIALQPAGAEGFGYDPVFYYEPGQLTFAEMTAVEKNRVSHRGQALERASGWLRERVGLSDETDAKQPG